MKSGRFVWEKGRYNLNPHLSHEDTRVLDGGNSLHRESFPTKQTAKIQPLSYFPVLSLSDSLGKWGTSVLLFIARWDTMCGRKFRLTKVFD